MPSRTVGPTSRPARVGPNGDDPTGDDPTGDAAWRSVRARLAGLPGGGVNIAHEAVDRHVDDGRADEVAIRFVARSAAPESSGEVWTFGRLAATSGQFAGALALLGVPSDGTVFVLAGRTPRAAVAVLGTLKSGRVVCPLFSAFGPEPIRQRMTIGAASVLVTTRSLYERKVAPFRSDLPARWYVLTDVDDQIDAPPGTLAWGDLVDSQPTTSTTAPTGRRTPALLHFTSGTTGRPKGAVHVHDAVAMHRATSEDVLGLRAGDVFWCTADPGWVTGISYGLIGPLAVGATLLVDEADFDPVRWYRLLAAQHVDVWYTAPTAIRMLMQAGQPAVGAADLSGIREAFSVGEPLSAEAVTWGQRALGITFRDTWWQTETGAIMIANAAGRPVQPGAMGEPVCGITATLLRTDEAGVPVRDGEGHVVTVGGPDEIGMIALRPGWPSMFRTYLGDDDRYQRCFADGWYLAGDLARRADDGRFWFVGRADDVIKAAGHLIGPFEVESVLEEHPDVTGAGVYGVPDPTAGEVIHACVVLRHGVAPDDRTIADVMAHARRRLGATLAPRRIVAVESLPTTRSGKVMRRLLRARELGLPEGDLSTLEPTVPT